MTLHATRCVYDFNKSEEKNTENVENSEKEQANKKELEDNVSRTNYVD